MLKYILEISDPTSTRKVMIVSLDVEILNKPSVTPSWYESQSLESLIITLPSAWLIIWVRPRFPSDKPHLL